MTVPVDRPSSLTKPSGHEVDVEEEKRWDGWDPFRPKRSIGRWLTICIPFCLPSFCFFFGKKSLWLKGHEGHQGWVCLLLERHVLRFRMWWFPGSTKIAVAGKWGPRESRWWFPIKYQVIFQPAMLVYQRVDVFCWSCWRWMCVWSTSSNLALLRFGKTSHL